MKQFIPPVWTQTSWTGGHPGPYGAVYSLTGGCLSQSAPQSWVLWMTWSLSTPDFLSHWDTEHGTPFLHCLSYKHASSTAPKLGDYHILTVPCFFSIVPATNLVKQCLLSVNCHQCELSWGTRAMPAFFQLHPTVSQNMVTGCMNEDFSQEFTFSAVGFSDRILLCISV